MLCLPRIVYHMEIYHRPNNNNIYRPASMEVGWGISPDYTTGQRTINNMIFERREGEHIPGMSLPEMVSPESIFIQTIETQGTWKERKGESDVIIF